MDEAAALSAYARAVAADNAGAVEAAARSYAAALAHAPENELLAARAVSQAIAAGDRALALEAAGVLEKAGKLTLEGRVLLAAEAIRTRDWKAALGHVERLEQDQLFAFMGPVLRAWIAQGSGRGDPLKALAAAEANPLAAAYAAEHRPLLLIARGKTRAGVAALTPILEATTLRGPRLRIGAAGLLAAEGKRKEALGLLGGDAPQIHAARALVEAKQPVPGAIDDAAAGTAELLVRIAADLSAQEVAPLALGFARLATFLAPESGAAHIAVADLLAGERQFDPALAALQAVAPGDPFASAAAEKRIDVLSAGGRSIEALAELRAAVEADPKALATWTRLGDLLGEMDLHAESAEAYRRAVDLAQQGVAGGHPLWALWLLHGGALTEAKDWPAGKAALEQAYKLAPGQAVVLNYLGYSQLERRENIDEAEKLIREASALQPDDASITDSLGWAHYVRGDYKRAIELLERAAQGQPADPAINEHLGDAYYSAGRRYEARYAWRAALLYAEGEAATRISAKIDAGLKPELAAP